MKQFKKNKDELAKECIRKEEVFADLINLSGIEKNRIVKAEELEECMRKEEYEKVDKETAEMINAYTGYKFRIKEEGGQVNMSRAFDELEKKWEKQGKEEEKINTAKRMIAKGFDDELVAQ